MAPTASLLASALAAAASLSLTSAQAPLSYTVLPAAFANTWGAACLDGSPPAFYSLVQDPQRWAVFIEGGGWCFDQTANGTISNCAGRAAGGGGSSRYNGGSMNVGGFLSSDPKINPNYYNWTLVFIHYCDGTSHSSNRTDPVPVSQEVRDRLREEEGLEAPSQIYFRGRNNLAAVMQYIRQNMGLPSTPTDLVLSGGSAGATSTYLALDLVASWFPGTRVVGAPDAGFFLDAFNVHYNTTWYSNCFQAALPVWNSMGGLNARCLSQYPTAPYKCFLQQYAATFIQTPYIILNSAIDMWQILNDLQLPCVPSTNGQPVAGVPSCSAAQVAQVNNYRLLQLQAVAPALQVPFTGAFIDTCFVHESNVDYCSTQPLPNCIGWNIYNVSISNPVAPAAVTMDQTFHAWHLAVTQDYDAVVSARADYIEELVAKKQKEGRAAAPLPLPSTVWEPLRGTVQVIDAVEYPNNPSCPFPTPSPAPAKAARSAA
jgi:hypothetical protein